jgi:hypothetical protein
MDPAWPLTSDWTLLNLSRHPRTGTDVQNLNRHLRLEIRDFHLTDLEEPLQFSVPLAGQSEILGALQPRAVFFPLNNQVLSLHQVIPQKSLRKANPSFASLHDTVLALASSGAYVVAGDRLCGIILIDREELPWVSASRPGLSCKSRTPVEGSLAK